ncbi:MAG: SAM-dependent methyltransferase [Acidimicrobiia bacterium]|nr:SAM-dependent methyltransferase [Acidimicrobiia bacterium]
MSPAAEILRREIAAQGPVSFARFMEVALYHPEHGYYQGGRDPFGRDGDFYTAHQLQPVFGILMQAFARSLHEQTGLPPDFTVVELGAGRGEMAPFFEPWRYTGVEVNRGEVPHGVTGLVYANEFFDALPVHVVMRRGEELRERHVGWSGDGFVWVDGGPVSSPVADYLARYGTPENDGDVAEVNLEALRHLRLLTERFRRGFLLAIDYGYTQRELIRFPAGTLMSYRRHQAMEDVLAEPGERDITSHVNFTALEQYARALGWRMVRLESLASLLLRAGEPDQFGTALEGGDLSRRLQLKTLLYGMGETFRALLLEKKGEE